MSARPCGRKCPPHIQLLAEAHRLARHAYELQLEEVCRGHLGGPEEAEYRAQHPGPLFKDALIEYYALLRHYQEEQQAA